MHTERVPSWGARVRSRAAAGARRRLRAGAAAAHWQSPAGSLRRDGGPSDAAGTAQIKPENGIVMTPDACEDLMSSLKWFPERRIVVMVWGGVEWNPGPWMPDELG